MGEAFIVRKGGVVTEQALAPTITEVSTTETSITFTITNNDAETAVILWEVGDTTPDANSIELAAAATSDSITVTGLDGDTEYIVYATANVTSKIKSPVASASITTDEIIPVPVAVGDLLVWFDAAQITGLSNNDSVDTWEDSSGNGYDAEQTTSGKRPLYKTNQVNSLPVVDFDGSDDFLVIPSSNVAAFRRIHSGEGVTIFIVNKKANTNTTSTYMCSTNAGAQPGIVLQHDAGSAGMYFDLRRSTTPVTYGKFPIGSGTTNAELITVRHGTSQTNDVQVRINETGLVDENYGQTPTTNNPGQNLFIGSNAAGTAQFMSGFICEIIIYNKLLTNTDRDTVEDYLTTKWGI